MKAIQITVDEALLKKLDADAEVRALGRSAVLRRAVEAYLKRKRTTDLDEAYQRAYGGTSDIGPDWQGWPDEGVWPED